MSQDTSASPIPCLLGEGWPSDRPGGLNRYVRDLVDGLNDRGVPVRAVVVGPVQERPACLVVAGDARQPVTARVRAFAAATRRVTARSDIIDTHFALYGFLPTLFGPARHLPQIVHFHGPWADEGVRTGEQRSVVTLGKRGIERLVYRRAAAVVTLSNAFRQVAVERYRVSPWRVHVIPPSVDLDRFTPSDSDAARARWQVAPDVQVVACVRRLVPRMGIDDLIRAWASLPDRDSRLLLIGGEGPARDHLEDLSVDLGVDRTVRFLGRLLDEDLPDLYRAADVCVVPSTSLEGFGLVVLESLACATPVIVTDAGGLPEAVAGLGTDVVVPVERPDLLAARIDDGLSGRRPLPSPASCRAHAERYSRSAMADSHITLYEQALSRRLETTLRVVFLDHCAKLSGAEIAMLRLLAALPDVSTHVILAEDGPLVPRLHAAGASVEVLGLNPAAGRLNRRAVRPGLLPIGSAAHTAWYVARLGARLRALHPDVVHCNSLKACLYGSLAARGAGSPVVWHARDRIATDYLPASTARLVRTMYRMLPHAAIANSQTTLDTLATSPDSRPAVVIPDPFRRTRPITALPGGPLRIGVVGRLADWKGQHVVLEAFARAFPSGEQRCSIVGAALFGEDAYARGLLDQARGLGIAERVDFRGFRDDVEAEMDAVHVVVHASVVPEPFGQVIVEAMAAKRAVVAPSAGGPAEIIRDGCDGMLYPPGDVTALATVLGRLDADRALCERLASAAVARANDFDPDVIGAAVRSVYRSVAHAR